MPPLPAVGFDVRIVEDVRIPALDPAVTLSGDLYLPVRAEPVPALVSLLPYRKDALGGIGAAAALRWFAAHGFATLLVDVRGTGSSDGRIRPAFDPGEADDGVAAIEWAARQPWCTGAVGMWGHSYGAVTTLRTAARRPEPLKAIIPVMGFLDAERDFIHPCGVTGCLASLGIWGLGSVLNHVLPPLRDHDDVVERQRWRRRLDENRPYVLDLFRHPAGHPAWRDRVIDAAAITAPAFCVAGWRDLFVEGSLRAYENIVAPKKLLVGPWLHTMPEDSPFEPVDFPRLALRWWDRWLLGIDNGVDRDPPVTLYLQGDGPSWRHYESWPPPAKTTTLTGVPHGRPGPVVGVHSGLWGIPTSGFGLPQDQHDDDLRSQSFTGRPLDEPLRIIGRPTVAVATQNACQRLVVKLADVDPDGRSTLISGGITVAASDQPCTLEPVAYVVPAGHRLRVVITTDAFPRLWPSSTPPVQPLAVELTLPMVSDVDGTPTTLPAPSPSTSNIDLVPRWDIDRDLINDAVTVTVGGLLTAHTPHRDHRFTHDTDVSATTARTTPGAASLHGTSTVTVHPNPGETITARVELRVTGTSLIADSQVTINGTTIFSRQWQA
ncbi:MAG TPA: CocE/NonD family hydrolase [Pseudonocardiaceae bacterium]|nr:CocE/NonD family hydrolase [Pseudonocardiaceae bacterium]